MSIPLPGPYDEDEDDGDDGGLAAAWHECLEWAERGDVEHLARMLRSDASLQDDPFVRAFLADVLDGKIKRPRGKPVKRPERAWWINPDGTPAMIDIRDKRRLEIGEMESGTTRRRMRRPPRIFECMWKACGTLSAGPSRSAADKCRIKLLTT